MTQPKERIAVAYTASTATEAMIIRSLLDSAGILSPDVNSSDPFPMRDVPDGSTHGAEIFVPESQIEEARRIIAEYSKSGSSK
jgi:Putative prokaryotic signal transducing protein